MQQHIQPKMSRRAGRLNSLIERAIPVPSPAKEHKIDDNYFGMRPHGINALAALIQQNRNAVNRLIDENPTDHWTYKG